MKINAEKYSFIAGTVSIIKILSELKIPIKNLGANKITLQAIKL